MARTLNAANVRRKLSNTTAAVWAQVHGAERAGTLDALYSAWGFYDPEIVTAAPVRRRLPSITMSAAMMDQLVREFGSDTGRSALAA
jgi:hypothetical protein